MKKIPQVNSTAPPLLAAAPAGFGNSWFPPSPFTLSPPWWWGHKVFPPKSGTEVWWKRKFFLAGGKSECGRKVHPKRLAGWEKKSSCEKVGGGWSAKWLAALFFFFFFFLQPSFFFVRCDSVEGLHCWFQLWARRYFVQSKQKKHSKKEKERKKKKRIEMKRKRTFVELEPAQPSRPLCMKRGWKISLASRCWMKGRRRRRCLGDLCFEQQTQQDF